VFGQAPAVDWLCNEPGPDLVRHPGDRGRTIESYRLRIEMNMSRWLRRERAAKVQWPEPSLLADQAHGIRDGMTSCATVIASQVR
jgi:hypothetical protein